MDITLSNGNFVPEIKQLPIAGKDIVVALETAKIAIGIIKEIGNAIITLAKELGIIPNLDIDELGARAIQAMEKNIRPEDFATTEEWVNRIMQDDWGYDLEISASVSQEEKVYMGIGTMAAFLIDKFEQFPMKDFILLASTNPSLFAVNRMDGMAKLILSDSKVFETIVHYLSGQDKSRETVEMATDTLVELEKSIDPTIDENEAYKRVVEYSK